jgi:hypothetical protein
MLQRRLFTQALMGRAALNVAGPIGLLTALSAQAQDRRDGRDGRDSRDNRDGSDARDKDRGRGQERERNPVRNERSERSERPSRPDRPDRGAPVPPPARPRPNEWVDARHGHSHTYPVIGYRVPRPPPQASIIVYDRRRYWFDQGVWYAGAGGAYVVTRPPRGVRLRFLPAFATVVTIGLLSYYYANGVYYVARPGGYYEVVDPPGDSPADNEPAAPPRNYVYPRNGQSPQQQASDEYECHRWAVGQSGFDPSLTATGQAPTAGDARRADYDRANLACLEGRGYSVR